MVGWFQSTFEWYVLPCMHGQIYIYIDKNRNILPDCNETLVLKSEDKYSAGCLYWSRISAFFAYKTYCMHACNIVNPANWKTQISFVSYLTTRIHIFWLFCTHAD